MLGGIAPCWSAKQQLWHFFKGKLSPSFKAEKEILARGQAQQVETNNEKRAVCLEDNKSGSTVWKRKIARLF